jgi:hypothetical protein
LLGEGTVHAMFIALVNLGKWLVSRILKKYHLYMSIEIDISRILPSRRKYHIISTLITIIFILLRHIVYAYLHQIFWSFSDLLYYQNALCI